MATLGCIVMSSRHRKVLSKVELDQLNSSLHTTEIPEAQVYRLIRRIEIQRRTGLSASSIYQLMGSGDFPQSVQLSERRVAWVEGEVNAWIESRIHQRNQGDLG